MGVFGKLFGEKSQPRTIHEFVSEAVKGRSNLEIKISDSYDLPTDLMLALEKRGIKQSEAIHIVDARLVGICPDCGLMYTGEWLAHVSSLMTMRLASRTAGLSGEAGRFQGGKCKNPDCDGKDILVLWDPDASSPLDIFLTALNDVPSVRETVAFALGEFRDIHDGSYPIFAQKVLPVLTTALNDKNEDVRTTVEEAINKLRSRQK